MNSPVFPTSFLFVSFMVSTAFSRATVKNLQDREAEGESFTVSDFADGKRKLKMFAELGEAHADAKFKGISRSKSELDVLHAGNAAHLAYVQAVKRSDRRACRWNSSPR